MLVSPLFLLVTDANVTQPPPAPTHISQDTLAEQALQNLRSPSQSSPEVNPPESMRVAFATQVTPQAQPSVQAPTRQESAPQPSSPESAASSIWSNATATSQALLPLKLGSQGQTVLELQQQLQQLGYSVGSIDGHYGQQTQAAVIQFQQAQGLQADGVVGAATLASLSAQMGTPANSTFKSENTVSPEMLENEAHWQAQMAAIEAANFAKERWIGFVILLQLGGWGLIFKDVITATALTKPKRRHQVRPIQAVAPSLSVQPTGQSLQGKEVVLVQSKAPQPLHLPEHPVEVENQSPMVELQPASGHSLYA